MVAIYTRVSTKGQEDNYSLPKQLEDGIAFAQKKGLPYTHYKDIASGGDITREGIVELQRDLLLGEFKFLWVGALDRLSRDTVEALGILKILRKVNCQLYAGGNDYDVHSSDTQFILTILWAKGEKEKKDIVARTGGGRTGEINAGRRKFCYVYGYDYDGYDDRGKRRIVVKPDEMEVVQLIYRMYLDGKSFTEIARYLNENTAYKPKKTGWVIKKEGPTQGNILTPRFDPNTISKILHRPEYVGLTPNRSKELVQSIYPPILLNNQGTPDREMWVKIQETIDEKTTLRVSKHIKSAGNLLSGLIRCPQCGSGYFFHKTTKRHGKAGAEYNTYMHKSFTLSQRACVNNPKNLFAEDLDRIVSHVYESLIYNKLDFMKFAESQKSKVMLTVRQMDQQILELEKSLSQLDRERKTYVRAVMQELLDEASAKEEKARIENATTAAASKKAAIESEKRMLLLQEDTAFVQMQNEELWHFHELTTKQKRAAFGVRLNMQVEAGVLKIRSIIGSEYQIDVSSFKRKCDSVHSDLSKRSLTYQISMPDTKVMTYKGNIFSGEYLNRYGKKISLLADPNEPASNYTGVEPSEEKALRILEVMKEYERSSRTMEEQ